MFLYIIALKLLSEPENLPAMINCAHGKDRTGVVSALVQSVLGKSEQEIAAEYALSMVCWQLLFFNCGQEW